jgi:hypothetical protein
VGRAGDGTFAQIEAILINDASFGHKPTAFTKKTGSHKGCPTGFRRGVV